MPARDLALLRAAARAAGEIALRFFRRDPQVTDKPDGAGPVTEADLAVNTMLGQMLRQAQPDYGWLSEETEDSTARLATRRQFVVDPIDGTRAFIEGSKDWAHALAIVEDGAPIAAAIYLPVRDLMYTATVGGGAMCNGLPLRVTDPDVAQATLLGAKINLAPQYWRAGQVPPVKRSFRSSLAYRLCLVADGSFDGMLTFRPSWEWDIAAGALIAAEAGAVVSDQAGKALRFNNPHPQVPGVLAAGPRLHRDLAARLAPQR